MLRQLAVYHQKDPNNLFMVRLAQGLTHLGKGTLTLCPYHSDKALMSPVAVAGLMAVVTACLDVKTCKSFNGNIVFRIFLLKSIFTKWLCMLTWFKKRFKIYQWCPIYQCKIYMYVFLSKYCCTSMLKYEESTYFHQLHVHIWFNFSNSWKITLHPVPSCVCHAA